MTAALLYRIASVLLLLCGAEHLLPGYSHTRRQTRLDTFSGAKAGDERTINGVKLMWCPPSRF